MLNFLNLNVHFLGNEILNLKRYLNIFMLLYSPTRLITSPALLADLWGCAQAAGILLSSLISLV